ncbi:RNA-binding region-containing protein 3 [Diabrotica virgifera virgifera]|uniref:RRM domain-containing protein n=1 Tax=Diabrotica virgifera virgifera TaxID=50390 RepID=A0ABM5JTC3_DIAVI|nr:RNA-binding region-containing protein 3 [Diabrotica virgifera virgifera]
MVCKDTLKIKNLPKELSDAHKEDFARHFGASKVKVVTSRVKEKSVVYAKFDSEEYAKSVMFRLHQINVLNCRLCVEYAENDIVQGKPKQKRMEEPDITSKKAFKTFVNKITSFNDSVNFHQPPPSHLKYLYPKANRATINNIVHVLTTIPRFYTQVLHLMNKMNLPPPFAVEQPPVRTVIPVQQPIIQKPIERVNPAPAVVETPSKPPLDPEPQLPITTSESELESDSEDTFRNREYMPLKRKAPQKKMIKRPKFIKPPIVSASTSIPKTVERTENVFEKVDIQVHKKIEMKVSSEALLHTPQKEEKPRSIGTIPPKKPEPEKPPSPEKTLVEEKPEEQEDKTAITAEELAANRINHKDLGVLPVFKNYHPGVPTCRLYIKNCAKTVTTKDLEYIYNRYKISKENTPSQFDIRLMQEGRMKGQAFVTLDSLELAQKAVKETNGYILKDKPLVVVFARSAVQKK